MVEKHFKYFLIDIIMQKLNFKKLENVINYYDIQKTFKKDDGSELTWEEIENRGMTAEEEFPINIKMFEKLGYKLSELEIDASDNDDSHFIYTFHKLKHIHSTITIVPRDDNKFTLKEILTTINLVNEQIKSDKKHCYEVELTITSGLPWDEDDERVLYHQEATDFGLWWEDLIHKFNDNINEINEILIQLNDHHNISINLIKGNGLLIQLPHQ
jgi:hypothetical protein